LLESLEEQAQASLAAAGDERSSADNEVIPHLLFFPTIVFDE
jgi:hypothetical protein